MENVHFKIQKIKEKYQMQQFYFHNCLHIKGHSLVSDYCEEPDQLVFEILEKYVHKKLNSNLNVKSIFKIISYYEEQAQALNALSQFPFKL